MKKKYNKSIKSNKDSTDKRIQEITTKLEQLEVNYIRESRQLKEEIAEVKLHLERGEINKFHATKEEDQFHATKEEDRTIKLGSTVRITNNYKGGYGIIGKATSVDNYWVWITNPLKEEHKRAHRNVEKLKHDVGEYRIQGNQYYKSETSPSTK